MGYVELSNRYTIDRRRKADGEIFLASYTLKFSQTSKQCKIELQRIYLARPKQELIHHHLEKSPNQENGKKKPLFKRQKKWRLRNKKKLSLVLRNPDLRKLLF